MKQPGNQSANSKWQIAGNFSPFFSPYSLMVFLFIIMFAVFFSALAVQQHHAFQTNGLDLGNVDQALWNTAHGRFLQFTLMTPLQSRLALHVEPILLLFTPLYWLNLGGPETLLIIQAVMVALGAWPLSQIANDKLQMANGKWQMVSPIAKLPDTSYALRSILPAIFALAYLLLPTLQAAVLYDFHAVTLAPTFLLFAFWALERKQNAFFIVFSLLAMSCKEDMPLVVALMGLYAGLTQRRWRLAALTIGLSGVWFAIAFFVIQPHFAAAGNIQLNRYAWLGDSPLEMLSTWATQPGLVFNHLWVQANLPGYLAALFFPTAFLALFSPLTLLPMLPTLAINLLSDNPFTWRLEDFHYGAPLAPFLFIAAIDGIRRVSAWTSRRRELTPPQPDGSILRRYSAARLVCYTATLLLLIFTVIYHYYNGFTPLARPFLWPQVTPHQRQLEQLLTTLPPSPAIFAQSNLAPHLTHRPVIYTDFAYFTNPDYPAPSPVEDILLDITAFENSGGLHQFLRQTLIESGNYHIVTARDGLLHLQPQPPGPVSPLPAEFYTFTRSDLPPAYPLSVNFADAVRLRGYSLHFNRQEEVQVSVDLEPLRPLPADLHPVLYLLDVTGRVTGATTDLPSALVWYPPDQWPVGETTRIRFNTLPWYTRNTQAYGLALGLVSGNEVWDVGRRLRFVFSQPSPFATRLPADGTLVELARLEQVGGMPEGGPVARQFAAPTLTHPLTVNFDNQVQLLGYTTPKLSENSPLTLTMTLYWQAVHTPPALTRFVQMVGPDGRLYGQNDSAPDNGNYPTYLWQPGEVVAETVNLSLPANRPPGKYTLHIGLYRPETGQRLPLVSGGDHIEMAAP